MNKPITKSLFVDYCDFPKMARWKANDSEVYKKIRKIESQEQEEHIIAVGQAVEDVVYQHLQKLYDTKPVDLMPSIKSDIIEVDDEAEDNEDFVYFPRGGVEMYEVIAHNTHATIEAIRNKEKILYQPGFSIGGCFVRADFMVLQPSGQYDLIEVKAKSSIRKKVDHEKIEYKNAGNIDDKFVHDVSFQKRVINNLMKQEGLPEIADFYVYYLNRDYVKFGPIDVMDIVAKDKMGIVTSLTLPGEKKEKIVERVDQFMLDQTIENMVNEMKHDLWITEDEFNRKYEFPGNQYLKYFGKKPDFGTVCGIPKLHYSKAPIVQQLYCNNRHNLLDLSADEKDLFNSKDPKNGLGSAREFIERYIECTNTGNTIVHHDKIEEILDKLTYPICFYDYETISVPVPMFDNSHPYQQVVVQYSLHKYYKDGRMEHFGGILGQQGDPSVDAIVIEGNANAVQSESEKVVTGGYKELLQQLLIDIGDDIDRSTFIVRYSPFENTRNKEIGVKFPDLKDAFQKINDATYDLMEIFSQNLYFDLGFHGSSSIKKVLPIMVPGMKYDDLAVKNGGIAMQKLEHLISGKISNTDERDQITKDLLIYCGQDSLAMFKIYEALIGV